MAHAVTPSVCLINYWKEMCASSDNQISWRKEFPFRADSVGFGCYRYHRHRLEILRFAVMNKQLHTQSGQAHAIVSLTHIVCVFARQFPTIEFHGFQSHGTNGAKRTNRKSFDRNTKRAKVPNRNEMKRNKMKSEKRKGFSCEWPKNWVKITHAVTVEQRNVISSSHRQQGWHIERIASTETQFQCNFLFCFYRVEIVPNNVVAHAQLSTMTTTPNVWGNRCKMRPFNFYAFLLCLICFLLLFLLCNTIASVREKPLGWMWHAIRERECLEIELCLWHTKEIDPRIFNSFFCRRVLFFARHLCLCLYASANEWTRFSIS